MRWPIRNQIFVPFASLAMFTIAALAVAAAVVSANRSGVQRVNQVRRVVDTLGDATFPYNQSVLQKMKGLSGADFIAVGVGGEVVASTFPVNLDELELPLRAAAHPRLEELSTLPVATLGGDRYFVAAVGGSGRNGVQELYVLYPEQTWYQSRWEAAWPPLAVGVVTLVVTLLFSGYLSQRLASRIHAVQGLFARLAVGEFVHVQPAGPQDEVFQLVESANTLSDQLSTMRQQICHTERLRLLAQLAGGLAHQLRNAVTGARMAIQLHQRRCQGPANEEALHVALRQLTLTEEQIKSLLSLAKPSVSTKTSPLSRLLVEVSSLVQPACDHAKVQFGVPQLDVELAAASIAGADEIKAALLNLVLNAIEAAGVGGSVRIEVERDDGGVHVHVVDSGAGPTLPGDAIFEPFVSTKPEGVGLGLCLAQTAARGQGGDLSWSRQDQETVFTMTLPVESVASPGGGSKPSGPEVDVAGPAGVQAGASMERMRGRSSQMNAGEGYGPRFDR